MDYSFNSTDSSCRMASCSLAMLALRPFFIQNDFCYFHSMAWDGNYFVYILTNKNKTVLYTGVTNDLVERIFQHQEAIRTGQKTFTARYNCDKLIYFEHFIDPIHAIEREKEIKGWTRKKKEALINQQNPGWKFLTPPEN